MSAVDGVCLVAIRGEFVFFTAPVVRGVFASASSRGQPVLVDLSETEFMDASAVRLLCELSQRLGGRRRLCVVASPRGVVRRLLGLTDMELQVTLRATRAQGRAALMNGTGPRGKRTRRGQARVDARRSGTGAR